MKKGAIKKLFLTLGIFIALPLYIAGAEETLNWQNCIAEAVKNNPDLISAVESVNRQKAVKSIAVSGLLPQIDADASGARNKTSTTTAGVTKESTTSSYSYGASGTQLIFDGFKTINDVHSASEDIKAAQQNYRFVSSDVRLSLRNAFIDLLKAQELIKVAEEIVDIRRSDYELITLRYQSGLEHRGALLTSEANLAQAEFELSQAKRDVETAQRELTKQMGRREFRPFAVNGDFTVIDSAIEKPGFEDIVKNNPSLLQALAEKNSAMFGIRSAYGNFAPQITGSAGADRKSPHWPPENDQWNAGLSLNMPIFEGGLRTAQVSQAKAVYKQAEADERSIRDSAVVSLQQTWAGLRDSIETVDVKRKTLEAAAERSRIAEAQYSTGFIAFDNWIIIENDLVSAKRAYLDAQANALYSEAGWIQAKGETLEYAK